MAKQGKGMIKGRDSRPAYKSGKPGGRRKRSELGTIKMPRDFPVFYSDTALFRFDIMSLHMFFGITEAPVLSTRRSKSSDRATRLLTHVIMSPSHFKRFAEVAEKLVEKYESSFGRIPSLKESPLVTRTVRTKVAGVTRVRLKKKTRRPR